ncbi:MAG: Gfo/Idh/MocA family oxidoreductase [Cyclobacteriaceae bacterium]|nr:Gfo/Idh/MocA family oxidoreductase [Cyclobacteriaceae bacterium]
MNTTRRKFIKQSAMSGMALGLSSTLFSTYAESMKEKIRIGIIGLDTSHAPAFAKLFNAENSDSALQGFNVVAAYPHGSTDIKSSVDRIPEYTKQVQQYGVEVVDSIKKMLNMVDVVLLETNDGRPHLEQAREVFKAGKPVFIDKPVAGSLNEAVSIFKEAVENKIPIFSSSSLRYMKNVNAVRYENKIGKVLGADTFSPATREPHHPDLFWYGIHGVEVLFAVMGAGCETVTRFQTEDTDVVVGKWKDGRLGTFRGTRSGKHDYGGTAYGTEGNLNLGPFDGYDALAVKIGEFFKSKVSPINARETLEIYAFMEAADESKRKGGATIRMDDVLKKAGYK